jgi:hypothetical protein
MTLNRTQRVIVNLGASILFFRLLFPPWTWPSGKRIGAALLFNPPFRTIGSGYRFDARLDIELLFFQVAVIVLGTALLVWWFQPRQAPATRPSETLQPRTIVQQLWRFLSSPWCLLLYLLLAVGLGIFAGLSRPEP